MQIGKVLHQIYRVDQFLGEGGPSVVYKGTDLLLGLPVAIKQLKQDDGNQLLKADRFLREARTQARLTHPHIVAIKAVFENEDGYFIVMEYVDGTDLEHLIRDSKTLPRLPLEQIGEIFGQLLDALHYAHKEGVIHRDIKPANVMLTRDGKVKLADFGIARSEHEEKLTKTGVLIGTPAYLPPEQLHGKPLDHRSDIYSIGAALFESVMGRTPFESLDEDRTIHQILKDHLFSPPPSLRALGADIPEAFDLIVQQCLTKTPEERPANCKELRRMLLSVLPSAPTASSDMLPAVLPKPLPTPIPPSRQEPPLPKKPKTLSTLEAQQTISADTPTSSSSRMALFAGIAALLLLLAAAILFLQRPKDTPQQPLSPMLAIGTHPTHSPSNATLSPKEPRPSVPQTPSRRTTPSPATRQEPTQPTQKPLAEHPLQPSTGVPFPSQDRTSPTVRIQIPPPVQPKQVPPPPSVMAHGEMVLIPAGPYTQGHPLDKAERKKQRGSNDHPTRTSDIRSFWIDRFEVTMQQYNDCIEAKSCQRPQKRKQGFLFVQGRRVDLLRNRPPKEPVRWVEWKDAVDYCNWAGKRLPTEAEWEKAARGTDKRSYPWGSEEPKLCKQAKFYGCQNDLHGYEELPYEVSPRLRVTGKSPYGVYDMAGNVFEWVQDCYDPKAYTTLPTKDPVLEKADCKERVIRGGSFRTLHSIRTYRRYGEPIQSRQADIGVRCAWSAEMQRPLPSHRPQGPAQKNFRDDH